MAAEANGMSIINSHIENAEFSKVYLFGGQEEYLVNQYKNKLICALIDTGDSMNYGVFKGEDVKLNTIVELAQTMPFFADRRVILVEDSGIFAKAGDDKKEDKYKTFLDMLANLDTTVLVLVEKKIDKRSKLYKEVSKLGTVAMFDTPDQMTIMRWIKKLFKDDGVVVEDKAINMLVEYVGLDMNTLYNEVEKLKCYCLEGEVVTPDKVEKLSVNQVEGKIFEMMDALAAKNKQKTMSLYSDLLQLQEPAMRILFLITRQFNLLLKTKLALEEGADSGKIASVTKLQPFVVKKYIAQCKSYTYDNLVEKVAMCQNTDTSIKTGAMKDNLAVEMLIVNLLQ